MTLQQLTDKFQNSYFNAVFSGVDQLKVSSEENPILNITWSPPATPHGYITQYIVIVVNNDTEVRPAQHSVTKTTSSYYITEMDLSKFQSDREF